MTQLRRATLNHLSRWSKLMSKLMALSFDLILIQESDATKRISFTFVNNIYSFDCMP